MMLGRGHVAGSICGEFQLPISVLTDSGWLKNVSLSTLSATAHVMTGNLAALVRALACAPENTLLTGLFLRRRWSCRI
jgi:hypothetical protein